MKPQPDQTAIQAHEELKKLSQAFAGITEEMKVQMAKGVHTCSDPISQDALWEMHCKMCDMVYRVAENIHARIDRLGDEMWRHMSDGHLPPIKGAGKMEKALDTLGMSDDYAVYKPMISATVKDGARGKIVEIATVSQKS